MKRFDSPGSGALPTLAALLLIPGALGAQEAAEDEACPHPARLTAGLEPPLAAVRYLADDALAGRAAGSPGARCAGDYIAGRLEALGLEPAGSEGHGYFQPFPLRVGSRLAGDGVLRIGGEDYPMGDAWIPFGFSGSGRVEAPAVHGGYGFNRPGRGDTRYARTEVEDRVLVVEAGDPDDPHGRTTRADPHFKATVGRGRGAAAVVVLLPPSTALSFDEDELRPLLDVPAVAVRGDAAEAAREAAETGRSIEVVTRVDERITRARNVAALLPGTHPHFGRQYLVIGAHYDHLGLGGRGSLAPDLTGTIHNGADDNASGVAVLLEVARRLARAPEAPARSVLFIAFSGEERGLLGSGHWVESPTVPLERVAGMINLDMVGRLREERLTVMGTGTAREWPGILEEANAVLGDPLVLDTVADGFGPSDHASFYGEEIPVLHFFTNAHPDYHRPGDDWQKVNVRGMERIASLTTEVARRAGGAGPLTSVTGRESGPGR